MGSKFLRLFKKNKRPVVRMSDELKESPVSTDDLNTSVKRMSLSDAHQSTSNGVPSNNYDPPIYANQFKSFSKFGDTKSDGRFISLSQSDKWLKQAKVIDGKTITTTDTGIHFKKLKSLKVTFGEYNKFLADLATTKGIEVDEIKRKLANCGPPEVRSSSIGSRAANAVDRLTDPSRYTGSHKQRFDEAGRGRGIAGRKDISDNSGGRRRR